ncbi:Uncharacterised protein [uncultured archaeon]|nr:Uncharacterised protein [uncultured archaeon]
MARAVEEKARRMHQYVISRLSESGIFVVRNLAADHYLVNDHGQHVHFFLHSDTSGTRYLGERVTGLITEGESVANIFYKETNPQLEPVFFRALEHSEALNFGRNTRLPFSYSEARRVIGLRDLERSALFLQKANELMYYVPDNTQLGRNTPEGIVKYPLRLVGSKTRDSRDGTVFVEKYGVPGDKVVLDKHVRFSPLRTGSHLLHLVHNTRLIAERKHLARRLSDTQRIDFLRQTGTSEDDWGQEGIDSYLDPK